MITFEKLSKKDLMKMAKALYNATPDEDLMPWSRFDKDEKERFVREFIIPIPNVLAAVGLEIVEKEKE